MNADLCTLNYMHTLGQLTVDNPPNSLFEDVGRNLHEPMENINSPTQQYPEPGLVLLLWDIAARKVF